MPKACRIDMHVSYGFQDQYITFRPFVVETQCPLWRVQRFNSFPTSETMDSEYSLLERPAREHSSAQYLVQASRFAEPAKF